MKSLFTVYKVIMRWSTRNPPSSNSLPLFQCNYACFLLVYVIAWLVVVFGNNGTSDTLKLSKIPRAAEPWVVFGKFWNKLLRAGIIAKYYVQVMLLFVYNRSQEIFGNAQETFLFMVEKTNTGISVRSSLFTSMEETIDSFLWNQYKPFKANNMATLLCHRFLLLYNYYAEL